MPSEDTGRWRIQGRLRAESLLHVGTGETTTREKLLDEERKPVQVAAVALDAEGRPYVPSTSLKGVLRAWADRHLADDHRGLVERVFGADSTEDREGRGGDVIVFDARQAGNDAGDEDGAPGDVPSLPPYWCRERGTGVVARVSMDRFYGSASPQRLFHLEVVPPGAEFEVEIAGEATDGRWLEQVALVLAALESFGGPEPTRIGARSGDGWGAMSWHQDTLRRLRRADLVRWLEDESPLPVMQVASPLAPEDARLVAEQVRRIRSEIRQVPTLASRWRLVFDGPFLVRDVDEVHRGEGDHPPDAVARRDEENRPLLPASSFRGVLRAQAERILRTVGGEVAACGIGAPRPPCDAVETATEVRDLCPVCKVFGAAGWRAPLSVGRFVGEPDAEPFPQHFLAIDRFTGGGARERKFEVQGVMRPKLSGRLGLDLEALEYAGAKAWALGLLLLVLRDLAEGDLCFGSGAAKGYGNCRGEWEELDVPPPDRWPPGLLASLGLDPEELASQETWPEPDAPLGTALARWVEELGEIARRSHQEWGRDNSRSEPTPGAAR